MQSHGRKEMRVKRFRRVEIEGSESKIHEDLRVKLIMKGFGDRGDTWGETSERFATHLTRVATPFPNE
jgi:hypothetical protein